MHKQVLLGLLSLSLSGCGYFVKGPPDGHQRLSSFSCTESNVAPTLDAIWAGLNVAGGIRGATETDSRFENQTEVLLVGLGWGLVSGTAAAVGFSKTKRCREAKRLLAERRANARMIAAAAAERAHDWESLGSVGISPRTDTLTVGERLQLSATPYDSSGYAMPPLPGMSWWSSDPKIASVDAGGLVTAHATGVVTVGALIGLTAGGAQIVVSPAPPGPTN